VLVQQFAKAIDALAPGDRLIVVASPPVRQLAVIERPTGEKAENPAWRKRKLAEAFAPSSNTSKPAREPRSGEPPGNLMVPALLDEIGRNIIPAYPSEPPTS